MQKWNALFLSVSLVFALCGFASENAAQPAQTATKPALEKQPVFLFCPHKESAGAWSLYVVVDKNDPSKPLALGLEELTGKNSRDLTYKGVLAAQKDPATPRNLISQVEAKDFGSRKLEVSENNMLSIGINPTSDGVKLDIDARVSIDGHFRVGGPDQQRRSLALKYSTVYNCWQTNALALETVQGRNAVGKFGLILTGIVFVAGSTSVSRIAAVDEFGTPFMLMDK